MNAVNRRRLLRWAWDISALLALLAIPTLLVLETPIWQVRGWNLWAVAAMAASYVLGIAAVRWGAPLVSRAPSAVGTSRSSSIMSLVRLYCS